MFKVFWPDVRGGYFFRQRRVYMDFLRNQGGKIFYLTDTHYSRPPFVLAGNWRDRHDITALWHIKAEGSYKKSLVLGVARECIQEGAEKVITKLLSEFEAAEFGQWGFDIACRIAMLERRMHSEPPSLKKRDDIRIVPFRKKELYNVLEVDAAAFDDFWKLDARTMDAIASSCMHNVFLMARSGGDILGYTIGGANGHLGYLQRLGVHARHQGKGVGEDLGLAILHSLHRMGATTVMVNTQDDNVSALRLYESLGFHRMPDTRYILQYTSRSEDRGKR
jgi:ribosomal protein S18 acetylase RimI-like enzyme